MKLSAGMKRLSIAMLGCMVALMLPQAGSAAAEEVFSPASPETLATFEFNGNVHDSSGNGRDAILLGGDYVATAFGQGLKVSRDPQGIDWSAFAGLLSYPYTIEVVLTPEDTDGYKKLFSQDDADDAGWYYVSEGFAPFPQGLVGDGQMKAHQEHYLAFVSTAPDVIEVYFQGQPLGPVNASFTAPPVQAIFFRDDTHTGRGERLDGVIEALRISGVARTPNEISAIYQRLDADGDGLLGNNERNIYGTDPLDPDTDGDLIGDGTELRGGTCAGIPVSGPSDPNNPLSIPGPAGPITAPSPVGALPVVDEQAPLC